jgi:hypothetical protein
LVHSGASCACFAVERLSRKVLCKRVVAYLPKEKILVEADAFNPPAQADAPPPNPSTANNTNLVENIDRLKLDVATIIPIHYPADSRKVTVAELNRAVDKKD